MRARNVVRGAFVATALVGWLVGDPRPSAQPTLVTVPTMQGVETGTLAPDPAIPQQAVGQGLAVDVPCEVPATQHCVLTPHTAP